MKNKYLVLAFAPLLASCAYNYSEKAQPVVENLKYKKKLVHSLPYNMNRGASSYVLKHRNPNINERAAVDPISLAQMNDELMTNPLITAIKMHKDLVAAYGKDIGITKLGRIEQFGINPPDSSDLINAFDRQIEKLPKVLQGVFIERLLNLNGQITLSGTKSKKYDPLNEDLLWFRKWVREKLSVGVKDKVGSNPQLMNCEHSSFDFHRAFLYAAHSFDKDYIREFYDCDTMFGPRTIQIANLRTDHISHFYMEVGQGLFNQRRNSLTDIEQPFYPDNYNAHLFAVGLYGFYSDNETIASSVQNKENNSLSINTHSYGLSINFELSQDDILSLKSKYNDSYQFYLEHESFESSTVYKKAKKTLPSVGFMMK